jgi:GntR family transcriptional regulator, transcriptional repressor for pyruvate dehydrogenase complex
MENSKKLLEPIGKKSIVEAVINRITNSIITGELKKGDKIPTEMEFSENLNVGRNTVREAIKVLVYLGVLEIKRPGGTYVREGFSNQMLNPLLYSLILEDTDSKYMVELRDMFEVGIATLAIQNATEEDIEIIRVKLEYLISSIESDNPDFKDITDADLSFHNAIVEATHNPLIIRINSVTRFTDSARIKTMEKIINSGNRNFLVDSHKKIYEMIRDRDNRRVIEVIDYSYLYWKDNFNK